MWLLVVSFCHMFKILADLILLKGGVLVCCIFCFFFFSFRSGHFIANPMSDIKIANLHTILLLLKYYFAFSEQVFFLHGCIIKKLI